MERKPHPTHTSLKNARSLNSLAYATILDLETSLGINASGKEGRYAAFFGRDSMITCLKLLRVHKRKPDASFLRIIKKTLQTGRRLQGKTVNLKSGEKPGKIVHEYREGDYTHLTNNARPWYLYPDKTIRNYDSVDATPLFLILAAEYYNYTKDLVFLERFLPNIDKAFEYLEKFGPKSKDGNVFLEYQLHRLPPYGGIVNQGWMDSPDSILIHGDPPREPVALVETQGYLFKALRLWSRIYEKIDAEKSKKYRGRADLLKRAFNKLFLMRSEGLNYFAYANFGHKAHILQVRSNPGHCLWSSITPADGKIESIIDEKYLPNVVSRITKKDLFEPGAGVRTLSTKSKFFDPGSYHNGSIWPFDNGLIAEGLENFGFETESEKIKQAVLNALSQFGSAVELYCAETNGVIKEYVERGGHYGAHRQAWTAATILDFTT